MWLFIRMTSDDEALSCARDTLHVSEKLAIRRCSLCSTDLKKVEEVTKEFAFNSFDDVSAIPDEELIKLMSLI